MRVYLITEAEIDALRERCRTAFMDACARRNISPNLIGTPEHDMWATFNLQYCRWKSEVGGDAYKNIMPEEPTQ